MSDKDFDDDDLLNEIDNLDLGDDKNQKPPQQGPAAEPAQDDNAGLDDIDIDDDDFDLGELDDDLGDEAWDDFDDEDDDHDDDSASSSAGAERSLPPPKKSAMSKMVSLLIVVAALGGGGYFYISSQTNISPPPKPAAIPTPTPVPNDQMAQIPPTPAPDQTTTADNMQDNPQDSIPDLATLTDLPPMPAPISSETDSADNIELTDIPDIEVVDNVDDSAMPTDDGLTPLPDDNAESVPDFDLSILETDSDDSANMDDTTDMDIGMLPGDETMSDPITEMDAPDFDMPEVAEPDMPAVSPSEIEPPQDLDEPVMLPDTEVPETTVSEEDSLALTQATSELIEEKQALETRNEALQGKIDEQETQIASLNDKINALEKQIQELQNRPAAPVSATTKAPPPVEQPRAVVQTPKTSVKQPTRTKAKSWVLRSAQPGKAVISEKGSNDLRTIEVGDTVSGIGRVQAIDIIGGKWVVKGTQNSVSR